MQRRARRVPDLLVMPAGSENYFELEKLGTELGYRVKILLDLSNALDWLSLRTFDVLLIDGQCPLSEQQKLAEVLWNNNPGAHFIVYSFQTKTPSDHTQARLFGAEVVAGPDALVTIREMLSKAYQYTQSRGSNFDILVVEDLDSPRDIICIYLESLGFAQVTGVSSAKEALQTLENNPGKFSCILTDVRMPEMTGAEMILELRGDQRYANLPIVVLTAYGTVDCLLDCLRNGASGFLVKPPKRVDMIRELGRAMRIHKSGRNARLASADETEYVHELLEKRGLGS